MIAWGVLTVLITLACVAVAVPLLRRGQPRRTAQTNAGVLKQQLGDLEVQVQTGALTPEQAEPLKAEVMRRLLAEGAGPAEAARPLGDRRLAFVAVGLAGVVAMAAIALYSQLGRPDLAGSRLSPAAPQAAGDAAGHGDVTALISQLEAQMARTPGDPEGWRMLGWSYMQTGRYAQAATAYGHAADLQPNNSEYRSAQGEAFTRAGDGTVTPQARAAFEAAAKADPTDPRARYFLAVHKDQQGDHAGAMADWIKLLKSAPPDAPWAGEVREFVQRIAAERGIDLSGRLPPAPTAAAGAAPAPAPDDQQAMIRGMVEGLDARLKTSPKDAEGWMRLMRSRMVLGEPDKAADAYARALKAFSGAPEAAQIKAAARELGVPGA